MNTFYIKYGKRIIDIWFSIFLIIHLIPLLILISLYVYIFISKKVFFLQTRIGINYQTFTIFKFTTMNNQSYLTDVKRTNIYGKLLRITSLDELPQLLNIFKGEMSFIGPRPLLPEYLPFYNQDQLKRHLVKPGISGLAQVKGRNSISWTQSLKYDTWYVKHQSIKLDILISLLTIKKIFKFSEVNQNQQFTREPFNGKN